MTYPIDSRTVGNASWDAENTLSIAMVETMREYISAINPKHTALQNWVDQVAARAERLFFETPYLEISGILAKFVRSNVCASSDYLTFSDEDWILLKKIVLGSDTSDIINDADKDAIQLYFENRIGRLRTVEGNFFDKHAALLKCLLSETEPPLHGQTAEEQQNFIETCFKTLAIIGTPAELETHDEQYFEEQKHEWETALKGLLRSIQDDDNFVQSMSEPMIWNGYTAIPEAYETEFSVFRAEYPKAYSKANPPTLSRELFGNIRNKWFRGIHTNIEASYPEKDKKTLPRLIDIRIRLNRTLAHINTGLSHAVITHEKVLGSEAASSEGRQTPRTSSPITPEAVHSTSWDIRNELSFNIIQEALGYISSLEPSNQAMHAWCDHVSQQAGRLFLLTDQRENASGEPVSISYNSIAGVLAKFVRSDACGTAHYMRFTDEDWIDLRTLVLGPNGGQPVSEAEKITIRASFPELNGDYYNKHAQLLRSIIFKEQDPASTPDHQPFNKPKYQAMQLRFLDGICQTLAIAGTPTELQVLDERRDATAQTSEDRFDYIRSRALDEAFEAIEAKRQQAGPQKHLELKNAHLRIDDHLNNMDALLHETVAHLKDDESVDSIQDQMQEALRQMHDAGEGNDDEEERDDSDLFPTPRTR